MRTPMAPSRPPTFEATNARITAAALELHRALRDALERVLPSVDGARACGRALGLRRHLGWQVYAIARTADHAAVMRALPKARGWALVLKALHDADCPEKPLKALREAIRAMDHELAAGATALPALRAAAAGAMDTAAQRAAMLKARANATRANAVLHGVSVKSYLSSFLIGPAGADGAVGTLGGHVAVEDVVDAVRSAELAACDGRRVVGSPGEEPGVRRSCRGCDRDSRGRGPILDETNSAHVSGCPGRVKGT